MIWIDWVLIGAVAAMAVEMGYLHRCLAALEGPRRATRLQLRAIIQATEPFVAAIEAFDQDVEAGGASCPFGSAETAGCGLGEALTFGQWRTLAAAACRSEVNDER